MSGLKATKRWFLALTVLVFSAPAPIAIAQVNSQPIVQQLRDGHYMLCSIPALPANYRSTSYLVENDALCFWFSKRGDRIAGMLGSASTFGKDAICVEGQVTGSVIKGQAVSQVDPTWLQIQRTPEGMGNAILSHWLSKRPRALRLAQGRYQEATPPVIIFEEADLDVSNFFRYHVGDKRPPQNCKEVVR